jgi:hypothetical protein
MTYGVRDAAAMRLPAGGHPAASGFVTPLAADAVATGTVPLR